MRKLGYIICVSYNNYIHQSTKFGVELSLPVNIWPSISTVYATRDFNFENHHVFPTFSPKLVPKRATEPTSFRLSAEKTEPRLPQLPKGLRKMCHLL